jgi:cobalamin biosynthesis Mg chelatase CobN
VRATSHERWWVQQQEQQQLRRIDAISGRAISWAQLSQKEASNKKLAIICYPNTGASDFGQIHRLVKARSCDILLSFGSLID